MTIEAEMARDLRCQVLIVGAGPVGLLTALKLHQAGVDVVIVDRQPARYPLPRAVTCDHESQRSLAAVGLQKELQTVLEHTLGKGGENGTNFCWRDKDHRLIVDLHWERPTRSGLPFAKGFAQPELEGLLEDTCIARGIRMYRGYSLNSLAQDECSVKATLTPHQREKKAITVESSQAACRMQSMRPDPSTPCLRDAISDAEQGRTQEIRVTAKYLVGSDGANSTVRRLAGITNTELDFENDWLILDLLLVDGYEPPKLKKLGAAQICNPARPTTIASGQKRRRRFEFMRLPGESREDLLSDAKTWELLGPWGWTQGNVVIERRVIYTFHARWANDFYKDRVILAGDAMHLMPPFIGQGLNSGFRDASALGWRIPLLVSGIANSKALLDSYHHERFTHVRKLTEHCILLGKVVCETNPDAAVRRHAEMRANPPKSGYDPPLGRPGLMTDQEESGRLSLQRPLRFAMQGGGMCDRLERSSSTAQSECRVCENTVALPLFDEVFGYGWKVISMTCSEPLAAARPDLRSFFKSLGGKEAYIPPESDITGDYRDWFTTCLSPDAVVVVRPDFYVYGHAPIQAIDDLLEGLQRRLCERPEKQTI